MLENAWWTQKDPRDLAIRAREFADALHKRQHFERRARAEAALFLYGGSTRLSLSGASWEQGLSDEDVPPFFNLIQTAVDWFTSMMVRNRIRPYFLTEAGDNELQEKARCAGRAVEGLMRQLGVWDELGMLRCQDGHLFEAGGIKYAADFTNRRIVASRVRPWEFYVPEREARLGVPRQFVHDQNPERSVLASMFEPESEEWQAVMDAEPEQIDPVENVPGDHSDLVRASELWHLPSVKVDLKNPAAWGLDDNGEPDPEVDPGHDGKRVIVTRAGLLVAEPWPLDYIPVSWYKPRRDPVGFWSRSIPETLAGAQLEIMDIAQKIQSIMRRHAVPHLVVWKQANLNLQNVTNDHAAILESSVPAGQAAYYLTPQAVPSELFAREESIIRWAEKQLGVSEMSLAGVKPPSIEHAPGMEHLAEMEMIRHTAAFHSFERTHLDDARIIVDLLRMLAQRDDDMEVVFGESKQLERFKIKDFDMEREQYHLKTWPTNLFAQTPTAKFRQVKEFHAAGLFANTPEARAARRAMGTPDVEEISGDMEAEQDNIEERLRLAIQGAPDYQWIPTPDMDLALAKTKAKARINRLEAEHEEPEAIDRVRTFWKLADRLEKQAMAEQVQAQEGVAPDAAPPEPPIPPEPTLPNAPPMAA